MTHQFHRTIFDRNSSVGLMSGLRGICKTLYFKRKKFVYVHLPGKWSVVFITFSKGCITHKCSRTQNL